MYVFIIQIILGSLHWFYTSGPGDFTMQGGCNKNPILGTTGQSVSAPRFWTSFKNQFPVSPDWKYYAITPFQSWWNSHHIGSCFNAASDDSEKWSIKLLVIISTKGYYLITDYQVFFVCKIKTHLKAVYPIIITHTEEMTPFVDL